MECSQFLGYCYSRRHHGTQRSSHSARSLDSSDLHQVFVRLHIVRTLSLDAYYYMINRVMMPLSKHRPLP